MASHATPKLGRCRPAGIRIPADYHSRNPATNATPATAKMVSATSNRNCVSSVVILPLPRAPSVRSSANEPLEPLVGNRLEGLVTARRTVTVAPRRLGPTDTTMSESIFVSDT